MTKRFILPVLGLVGCLSECAAFGAAQVNAKVEMNAENPNYKNDENIVVEDGYGVWANGLAGFEGRFENNGNLLVTGADGWGFYETPYQTRPVHLNIINTGTIQRINMEQVDNDAMDYSIFGVEWKEIRPGINSPVVFDSERPHIKNSSGALDWENSKRFLIKNEGTIEGASLFGVNTTIHNSGVFQNFYLDDSSLEKGNLISMAYNGLFLNGIEWDLSYDGYEPVELNRIAFLKEAALTTDKVQFARQGMLINGALIDNKSIKFGEMGYLYNVGNPHDYHGELAGKATYIPSIKTGSLSVGSNSLIYNEMGTALTVDDLSTGTGTDIVVGGDYSLVVEETATIKYKDSDGNDVEEEVVLPTIPHSSEMQALTARLADDSTLSVLNNSTYTGHTLIMGKNNTLTQVGGLINITTSDGRGLVSVGDNSTISIMPFFHPGVYLPASDETDTGGDTDGDSAGTAFVESEPILQDAKLITDTLRGGNYITMTIEGLDLEDLGELNADLQTKKSIFDDYAHITVGSAGYWTAEEYISLRDNAFVNVGGVISAPLIEFRDNGYLHNAGIILGNYLNMGENSLIENQANITLSTTLGSNSQAVLFGGEVVDFDYRRGYRWPQFSGGIQSAEGATNVTIINRTGMAGDILYSGYLTNGVNVDAILVDTGELQMSGEVRGVIGINTDAQLRLVDTDVTIYDPISKVEGSENTKLIVDLEGDDHFYKTSNTINVDHIYIAGGGFEIDNTTRAQEILLTSNTSVRLNDNHYVGDIIEKNEDAANTTLDINGTPGKTIYSPGTIKLDRVVVEAGTFDINHTLEATYKSNTSVMPSTNESGLELGTDTVVNVNSDNVIVNRVVRSQLAEDLGQTVTNTTVNLNAGKMLVERNVDVDQLNIYGGRFEFQNKDLDNVVNIGSSLTVNHGGTLAGAGMLNLREGSLDVNEGGRFSVSGELLEDKPVSMMEIVQSEKVYSDADDVTNKGYATVNLHGESILDLRADGAHNDKIVVSGEVNIDDDVRVIIRNIEANHEYELIKATQLNGNLDKIRTSFLWTDPTFQNINNTLTLKITGVQTLAEGIATTRHSANVDSIAEALTDIKNRSAANTIDPFLDKVFYAQTAGEAIGIMSDYSPEGYLNLPHAGLRVNHIFRQSAQSELDDMRTYRDMETAHFNQPVAGYYASNPNYYGRPGYESYYNSWMNTRGRDRGKRLTRTDKGGLWVRPFTTTATQDDVKYISGYDFSSTGITAGIDKRFGALSLGFMGIYANGSMKQNNHQVDSDIQTYGAGFYGYLRPYKSGSFVNLYALWTASSNSSKHKVNSLVESAKADFNMNTYTLGADWGVDLPVNRHTIITPRIGIDYTKVSTDAFTEKGSGVARVQVTPDDYTSLQTPLEIRAALNFGNEFFRLKPEAHARWTHEFGDVKTTGKGKFINYDQVFGFEGVSVARDTYTLGGSLLWLYSVSELEFKYDYDFSSSSSGHTLNASYKYMF